jgi:hypothetical protein
MVVKTSPLYGASGDPYRHTKNEESMNIERTPEGLIKFKMGKPREYTGTALLLSNAHDELRKAYDATDLTEAQKRHIDKAIIALDIIRNQYQSDVVAKSKKR